MLEILAWVIFIPSFLLNLALWYEMLDSASKKKWKDFKRLDNILWASGTFLVMFSSGVYLFGL